MNRHYHTSKVIKACINGNITHLFFFNRHFLLPYWEQRGGHPLYWKEG